ncbi:MAG: prephenate dehydratase [Pseudomonadota bacterium]
MAKKRTNKIAFQGEPGANSHLAANDAYPGMEAVPCATFEDALGQVKTGAARLAMIPIENSVAGRVADIHHLLPHSGLYIIGEHFERIRHQLLALPGAKLASLRSVHSHIMALGQCRKVIGDLKLTPVTEADTAGAARHVSEAGDPSQAAIASKLAAEIYGLRVAKRDIEDAAHNTTRFVVLSAKPVKTKANDGPVLTTFVFRVRNVPAALYKALGGFATNGVNMTKLESYQLEGSFNATMFYADIEGHPDQRAVQLAMEELDFYTSEITILGTYPASPFRKTLKA